MEHLQAFISDCDRRTELAKRRLAETQEELSAEVAAKVLERSGEASRHPAVTLVLLIHFGSVYFFRQIKFTN